MAKPTMKDAIKLCLETTCAGRAMDDEIDRAVTVDELAKALAEPIREWLHEAVDCAVACGLDATERRDYATVLAQEAITLTTEEPRTSGR